MRRGFVESFFNIIAAVNPANETICEMPILQFLSLYLAALNIDVRVESHRCLRPVGSKLLSQSSVAGQRSRAGDGEDGEADRGERNKKRRQPAREEYSRRH